MQNPAYGHTRSTSEGSQVTSKRGEKLEGLFQGQIRNTIFYFLNFAENKRNNFCILATRRWEALDRSLRHVDAVLNEAAQSTGLELDRVCDGSAGGMLGGLTQMPPSPMLLRHAPFMDKSLQAAVTNDDEAVISDDDDDGAAAEFEQQAPTPGGVCCMGQRDRHSGSPCSSGGGCADTSAQDPPHFTADSPRHSPRAERSQNISSSRSRRQAGAGASMEEDITSPRHTPREEWSQGSDSSSVQEVSPPPDSDHQASVEDCIDLSHSQPMPAPAEATSGVAEPDPDIWFEVSPNTGRVHLHAAADGAAPFGLSIPVRALLARNDPEPLLEELVKAVESRSGTVQ